VPAVQTARRTWLARLAVLGALAAASPPARAQQQLADWDFGETPGEHGSKVFWASRNAANLIVSGRAQTDYAPLFILSCQSGDARRWVQKLVLEDSLSSSGNILVTALTNGKPPRPELWSVDATRKTMSRINALDVVELKTARRITFRWSWGWQWLWLSDEAIIPLDHADAVIYTLAKSCGIAEPQ
jgi:hypothetical protein